MKDVKKVNKKLSSIAGIEIDKDKSKSKESVKSASKMNLTTGTKLEGTIDEAEEHPEMKIDENTMEGESIKDPSTK